jgi:Putative  PD-(D/E)XK family member, (DUF4420)
MGDLEATFASLQIPIHKGDDPCFAVAPIGTGRDRLIAKDDRGSAAVLARVADGEPAPLRVQLQYLSVTPRVQCEVVFPGGVIESGRYTLIRCSGDDEIQRLFLRLVNSLVREGGAAAGGRGIARIVVQLIQLFQRITDPPRPSIQGLWAELFVIAGARGPEQLLRAWHTEPGDVFDFAEGSQYLEVKSSGRRSRVHRVALEQLYAPSGTVGVLASVVVERAGAGTTIDDLVDMVEGVLGYGEDLHAKLLAGVVGAIGSDWHLASRVGFDFEQATSMFALFNCADVPRIALESVPPNVSRVRFDTRLGDTTALLEEEIAQLGGIVRAASRRKDHGSDPPVETVRTG